MDLLKGFQSFRGFKLGGWVTAKFLTPHSGKTVGQTPVFWRWIKMLEVLYGRAKFGPLWPCQGWCSVAVPRLVLYGHAKFGAAPTLHAAWAAKMSNLLFLCLCVNHTFERQDLCA